MELVELLILITVAMSFEAVRERNAQKKERLQRIVAEMHRRHLIEAIYGEKASFVCPQCFDVTYDSDFVREGYCSQCGQSTQGSFHNPLGRGAPIAVWQPILEGRVVGGLGVPFSGQPMTRESCMSSLEERLHSLIQENIERAKSTLSASSEHSPNLYAIPPSSPPSSWAPLILRCDQMEARLSAFDWTRGVVARVYRDELPTLDEFVEQI